MNDFSKATLKALGRKGIYLAGIVAIPDYSSPMPFANAARGYVMNDNGTQKIWRFFDVLNATK